MRRCRRPIWALQRRWNEDCENRDSSSRNERDSDAIKGSPQHFQIQATLPSATDGACSPTATRSARPQLVQTAAVEKREGRNALCSSLGKLPWGAARSVGKAERADRQQETRHDPHRPGTPRIAIGPGHLESIIDHHHNLECASRAETMVVKGLQMLGVTESVCVARVRPLEEDYEILVVPTTAASNTDFSDACSRIATRLS